jgi:ELWxxDGT repeat protein
MRIGPVLLVCLLAALPALALEPYVVKDINPVEKPADSAPDSFATLGPAALFSADDGVDGRELWRSDGTEAGTVQVADLCQPSCSGNPRAFAVVGRLFFFLAADADTFQSLWATDGTRAGTFQLTDRIAVEGSRTRIGNVLYFVAAENAHGEELWRSDGTAAGTYVVADLRPGIDSSRPRFLTPFKGSVYFAADDGRVGGALWKTDGTAAGTVMVRDPVPALPANAPPAALRVVGGRLLFVAPTRKLPQELWASDGTTRGTQVLGGVFSGETTTFLDFSTQGNRLYYVAQGSRKGQELWVSDGTANGTRVLTHLARLEAFFGDGYNLGLPRVGLGNRFVFGTVDGPRGAEPWITDGTVKGTRLLRELCPGSCDGLRAVLDIAQPGRLYLTATDGVHGYELWTTDGTRAGTRLVRDLCEEACSSDPSAPILLGNRLLFAADDGRGADLWRTDGTAAGTVRIRDFDSEFPLVFSSRTVVGNQLLFGASGPEGRELWRTDGTAAGTRLVRDINRNDLGGSDPHSLMPLGDEVFFFANYVSDITGLWKSDGTAAGTVRVAPFEAIEAGQVVRSAAAGGLLFFLGRSNQLWRSDGAAAGTFQLGVQVCCSSPEIVGVGGTAFFAARVGEGPIGLWASDGTVAGTRQVRPGDSGPVDPSGLTAFQGKLYFAAADPVHGRELWRSDGTAAGTVLVKDIHPGSDSTPVFLTVHAGRLWFFADDGDHGRELWSSDGTAAGTALAVDIAPGERSFGATLLVSLGDQLLTIEGGQSLAAQIWVSDGTPAGTRPLEIRTVNAHAVFKGGFYFGSYEDDFREFLWVADGAGIRPVFDSAFRPIPSPRRFAALDGHLVFNTGEDDVPLWQTDGTPEGTFPILPETFPGSNGAAGELVRAGSRVFFPAYSREDGVELWAVEEAAP